MSLDVAGAAIGSRKPDGLGSRATPVGTNRCTISVQHALNLATSATTFTATDAQLSVDWEISILLECPTHIGSARRMRSEQEDSQLEAK